MSADTPNPSERLTDPVAPGPDTGVASVTTMAGPPAAVDEVDPLPKRTPRWVRFLVLAFVPFVAAVMGIEAYLSTRVEKRPIEAKLTVTRVAGQKRFNVEDERVLHVNDELALTADTVGHPSIVEIRGDGGVEVFREEDLKKFLVNSSDANHRRVRTWTFGVTQSDLPTVTYLLVSTRRVMDDETKVRLERQLRDVRFQPDLRLGEALKWSRGKWETASATASSAGSKQPVRTGGQSADQVVAALEDPKALEKCGDMQMTGLTLAINDLPRLPKP